MSARSVTFLGTGSQVPTRTRSHHCLFLQWDDLGVLFDAGEGAQRQMTLAGVSASQITHIVLSHFHGDHCLGLPGVLQRLSLDRIAHSVEVIYPQSGQEFFERLRRASIFHDVTDLRPRPLAVGPGEEVEVFRRGAMRLSARLLEHGVECLGYRLQEDDGRRMLPERLEAAGVRGPAVRQLLQQGTVELAGRAVRLDEVSEARPGQSAALVVDTRPCPGALALARGVDLLVCEATYQESETQEAHDHFHMTAAQAARLAVEAGARRLALTHFSPRYEDGAATFQREASALHPDVFVADDLARVAAPPRRG